MTHINLNNTAQNLPHFWKSSIIGQSGNCNIKILKMDEQQIPDETHDYNEALIVISGEMFLNVKGEEIKVSEGEMYLALAGIPHAVSKGSHGTLMIIDPVGS
ncbi:cupin domain-containing protein [Thalassospira sp. TSL5-1]|uniref:cupin domain-containing protein n=1 Tax=Thalassospira sp. TSL5-1 TaxID=1544451 RepID=UPI0009388AFC|nr:cupin domain-containing protein [Thalassospira sp. TSL5-1]OKH88225.1 cupin [Thalassospira sp. TSL5-1]